MQKKKKRILSGMRPTGKLHLGNYVGALENWIRLQNEYESYHMVADWHMLTTDPGATKEVRENSIQVVVGTALETPENIVQAYLSGSLVSGQNLCDH